MKDFVGNDINPYDLVAFSSFEGSSLRKGIVVKTTPKMVRIKPLNKFSWEDTVLRDPIYCVVYGHDQTISID